MFVGVIAFLLVCCSPKQDEVEKIIENGVEVVVNHLEPYKIKNEPKTLSLEEEFTIDTESDDLALKGFTEISGFDVDSEGNIYFLNQFRVHYNQPDKQLDRDSIQRLKQYSWPGNIRELENLLHREFLLADGPLITLDKISSTRQERRKSNIDRRQQHYLRKSMQEAKAEIVRRFEIEYLTKLLTETEGNVTRAAKRAGKERRSLGKLIKKHGIDKSLLNKI